MNRYLLSIIIFFLLQNIMITAQDNWKESFKISASDGTSDDGFGTEVDIDGDYAVVGVRLDSVVGEYSGSAYIFQHIGSEWHEVAKLSPSDGAENDFFGVSVAISDNQVAIGANGNDEHAKSSGAVYIFERPGSGWKSMTETAKITIPVNSDFVSFGYRLDLWENQLAVSAPSFVNENETQGAVFIFEKLHSSWKRTAKLTPSSRKLYTSFGVSVSMSGKHVAVSEFGYSNDSGSGKVYVYNKPDDGWKDANESITLIHSGAEYAALFGYDISVSDEYIVVSALGDNENGFRSGAVYVFEKIFFGWQKTAKLTAYDAEIFDNFGYSVSVSGESIVVGTYGDDDELEESGAAYVYEKNKGLWQLADKIKTSDKDLGDYFGFDVGISGGYIILSAPGDNINGGLDIGSAYIFENKSLADKYSTISFEAYPNPTSGKINLSSDNILDEEFINIHLVDINGRVVKSYNRYIEEIDLSDLTKGIYFLKMYQKNGVSAYKRIFKY